MKAAFNAPAYVFGNIPSLSRNCGHSLRRVALRRNAGVARWAGSGGSDGGGDDPSEKSNKFGRDEPRNGASWNLAAVLAKEKVHVSRFLSRLFNTLKALPAAYVTLVTAVITTFLNRRFKVRSEREQEIKNEQERLMKKKRDRGDQLSTFFERYSRKILVAAGNLAERLYAIGVGSDQAFPDSDRDGALYTAYLVGRFLGAVEFMRKESPVLDFGRPNADRLFSNLLHKVERCLGLSYSNLEEMAKFYGDIGVRGRKFDLFQISSGSQRALGELMRHSRWSGVSLSVGSVASGGEGINDRIIAFPDFCELFNEREEFRSWFGPIVECVQKAHRVSKWKKRNWCVRIGMLQSALLDVVDFLDPEPQAQIFHTHRRERLSGPVDDSIELPSSIQKLYSDTAYLMSGSVDAVASLSLDKGSSVARVYVKAGANRPSENSPAEYGDCPFSQKVLSFLRLAGIPHEVVAIGSQGSMPSWYLNLHPRGMVPVMEHGNSIVEESNAIIDYLQSKFPEQCRSVPTCRLPLGTTPRMLENFRRAFYYWLRGERGANEKSLTMELGRLENAIRSRPNVKDGPFFGGAIPCQTDLSILPHLHRVSVAGKALKGFSIPSELSAVHSYLEAGVSHEAIRSTLPRDVSVIAGYGKLMGPRRE